MKLCSQSATRALTFALIIVFAATVSGFASDKDSFKLLYPTKVGGTVLPAGDYSVQWDESGKVEILKGKNVVATSTATVTKHSHPVRATNVSANRGADGSRSLVEIEIAGKNVSLGFSDLAKGEVATAK